MHNTVGTHHNTVGTQHNTAGTQRPALGQWRRNPAKDALPSDHLHGGRSACGWGIGDLCVSLNQGWGTYLLSRATWIVEYRWLAAKIN